MWHNQDFPELDLEELNAMEQDWDGPWFVELRYHVAVADASDLKALRCARAFVEDTELKHDETPSPVRLLHYKARCLPYAADPFGIDEPDKEGV